MSTAQGIQKNTDAKGVAKNEKTKSKNNKKLTVLSTEPISEEELEKKINDTFGRHNKYYKVLKKAVDNLTNKYRDNIKNIMLTIRSVLSPTFEKKDDKFINLNFKRTLTNEELENYITLIQTELYFLNEFMEEKALGKEVSEYLKDLDITEELLNIVGGTAKERERLAQHKAMVSTLTSIIKTRVYYNLKGEIDAATRVSDSLKKVLTSRITEMQVFGKSSKK
ncbi:MAG: hypothetical protein ACOCRX_03175 [Candidatus Woesearchaeota archaeon]